MVRLRRRSETADAVNTPSQDQSRPEMQDSLPPKSADQQRLEAMEATISAVDALGSLLDEALMLTLVASRPEGRAQRSLIAARYAALASEIEAQKIRFKHLDRATESWSNAITLPESDLADSEQVRAVLAMLDQFQADIQSKIDELVEGAGRLADAVAGRA